MLATMEPKAYGRYLVYPDGRVWSSFQRKFLKQRVVSLYPRVFVHKKWKMTHRLVAELYLPRVDGANEVNHKDCDKLNPSVGNLEWVTKAQNMTHAKSMGRFRTNRHREARAASGLGVERRRIAQQMLSEKILTIKEIADAVGCTTRSIYRIKRKEP